VDYSDHLVTVFNKIDLPLGRLAQDFHCKLNALYCHYNRGWNSEHAVS